MPRMKVLNWYPKPRHLTKDLHKLFTKRKIGENFRSFVTMRHGTKWAHRLNPGDKVAISISKDPKKPNIIGYAEVATLKKSIIALLGSLYDVGTIPRDEDLVQNIGAKKCLDVWSDMKKIYGPHVGFYDIITIIDLTVLDKEK